MKVKTFQGGFDKNLSYIVWCEITGYAAVIDPAVIPYNMFDFILKNNLNIKKILITHSHHDHIAYIGDWINQYDNIKIFGYDKSVFLNEINFIDLAHQQIVTIGKQLLTALYTPGHYKDSMCYWNQNLNFIFTGDTIFVGRTGRTISNSSNIEDLYNSVYNILMELPENTIIYPGHHYGYSLTTTLKENKIFSPFFQCKSLSEFIIVMKNFEKNR